MVVAAGVPWLTVTMGMIKALGTLSFFVFAWQPCN